MISKNAIMVCVSFSWRWRWPGGVADVGVHCCWPHIPSSAADNMKNAWSHWFRRCRLTFFNLIIARYCCSHRILSQHPFFLSEMLFGFNYIYKWKCHCRWYFRPAPSPPPQLIGQLISFGRFVCVLFASIHSQPPMAAQSCWTVDRPKCARCRAHCNWISWTIRPHFARHFAYVHAYYAFKMRRYCYLWLFM